MTPRNVMFKVIYDIMTHRYVMVNTIMNIPINFCKAKKMNCALTFIIKNH